ncbi:hypothetical protein [Pseudoroseicyclus aestuarii]|uniref:Uncharacterized protein n=1 Tax=Pseudoroseicyclus aestuarii TaxID=1795041 RepID=A0A318SXV5_9RHOB|nr:hypothetical protein [Pseudoroseicyclus aestuarii]PYE86145.1 hypothetical protein DFP88_101821 [Pseudoroseicyclus aestuarii]
MTHAPRKIALPRLALCALLGAVALASACTPLPGLRGTLAGAAPEERARRGEVELAVKGRFPQVLEAIESGGGPALTAAFDAANVPQQDRPARILQLQGDYGLYAESPGSLVTSLLLWGPSPAAPGL